MATHIQNATIVCPDSSPDISYNVSYSATRKNNSQATYDFTIKSLLVSGDGSAAFGTGYGLKCTITINGTSGSVILKSTSDIWSGGSRSGEVMATDTLSITCDSSTGNANQTVAFEVERTDSDSKTTGEVSTSAYYVTSPALLYTKCAAPTSITITPSVFDDEVTISWSGATAGVNNAIKQYRIRYGVSDTLLENYTDWTYNELATTSDTSITIDMSDKVKDRQYLKIAVRTEGEAGDSYNSYFFYADEVQRKCRNVKIKQGNEWVDCATFIKQNGAWVESVVDIL